MSRIESTPDIGAEVGVAMAASPSIGATIKHHYDVECYGPDGCLKWKDSFDNLVTTAGKNKYLDATLKTGLAAPLWYVGLVTGPTETDYNVADTMASHAGWTEFTTYSTTPRPAFTPGAIAAGSVSNTASKAVFAINGGGGTVSGAFMADESTVGGATGTLLGVGAFVSDRVVISGDTLNVTITCTMS